MRKAIVTVLMLAIVAGGVFAGGQAEAAAEDDTLQFAVVVKSLGNGFFEAVRDGAVEAAEEMGGVEIIYQGPAQPTAEGQIEIIDSLIAQRVDGIAISANDRDALVPAARRAVQAGIPVISFDSGISAGRLVDLAPSDAELIGRQQVRLIAEMIDYEGQIAILSATSQATNQNLWIEWMEEELTKPEYSDMELVATVYGDDVSDKSYREMIGLMTTYPELRGVISPTTVGIAAAANAIEDEGRVGEIELTGLGLPSEMQRYIEEGVVDQMALWNPVDLGYTSTYILKRIVDGEVDGSEGDVIDVGRMGEITVGENGASIMGEPFVFDASNVAEFAQFF
jgi:rhamnose transport system substrate-binding protein